MNGPRAAAVVGPRPIGDNGAVAADYDRTDAFRGASFTDADFAGANFRDCDLRQVKITDSWLVDVSVSGLVGNFVVNDVDVTAFVESELDRRHPERVQLRAMRTADDYRAMWDTIERLWPDTVARARRLLRTCSPACRLQHEPGECRLAPSATYWPFSPGAATQTRVPMRMMLCPPTWMRAAPKMRVPKTRVRKTGVCSAVPMSVLMWSASASASGPWT